MSHSSVPHLIVRVREFHEGQHQILAGLEMLSAAKALTLEFARGTFGLELELEDQDGRRLVYDMFDGGGIRRAEQLDRADLYFKRSLDYSKIPEHHRAKVLPYGLLYNVHAPIATLARLRRSYAWRGLSRELLEVGVLGLSNTLRLKPPIFLSTSAEIELRDTAIANGRVLFLVRLWDPDAEEVRDKPELREERIAINRERVACVAALKEALGPSFTGGISPDSFSMRAYPQWVVADTLVRRPNFVAAMKQHAICVATRGLHGSIGWKFAEYIAMSRAIVTEPLDFVVPGELRSPRNFLVFRDPGSCVAAVQALASDHEACVEMMRANGEYYLNHLRPDRLMARTLQIAGLFRPSW